MLGMYFKSLWHSRTLRWNGGTGLIGYDAEIDTAAQLRRYQKQFKPVKF